MKENGYSSGDNSFDDYDKESTEALTDVFPVIFFFTSLILSL
jgi:hypothetical protein